MQQSSRPYWLLWLTLSLISAGALAWVLIKGEDKTLFMPGPLSDGHHQLSERCDLCHGEGLAGDEVIQQSCVDCHGDDRVKPFDSHPRSKFKDPRNADRLEKIDALHCVTCHTEHRPEITRKDGVTQPRDLCFNCHAAIGEDRPSHQGMAFDTCANAGCHNFHNNRALYTDFLVKHMQDPDLKAKPLVPPREFAGMLDELIAYPRDLYPLTPVALGTIDAPQRHALNKQQSRHWLKTRHARAGVNCSACHQQADKSVAWTERPGPETCKTCHEQEVARFGKGKHGMRVAAGLSPMTPAAARLPMKADAAHRTLDCNSCHAAHDDDVRYAAVRACLGCHDDKHSRAYKASPHYRLWRAERAGEAPAGSGVSCATCHMPRVVRDIDDWTSRVVVDHNQSANLSPNSKMIRGSCLHCHGLGFSIDALADKRLIENNFDGRPSVHVESINLARKDQERYLREMSAPGD